jgi:aldehyde:ferredoxin oxidoreductase
MEEITFGQVALGILRTIIIIIIGKIILYFLYTAIEKILKYFSKKTDYKKALKKIFDILAENENFPKEAAKLISDETSINKKEAAAIINLEIVQRVIIRVIEESKDKIEKTELENLLMERLIKAFTKSG